MNIAEWSIRHQTITWVVICLLLVGGILSYEQLGRLEDPEFTIKEALVITDYPGATAREVEEEVSDEIELAVQQLGQLKRIKSQSMRGRSIVTATIKDKYDKDLLPQVWDELRRKVSDAQAKLPPGTQASIVNDDYGDVYGIFFGVYGQDYSYAEIKGVVDLLRRELLLVPDVKKVELFGLQPEAVYVEMVRSKMAQLGVSQEEIYQALSKKNLVADAGYVQVGSDFIPIDPTGAFTSVSQFKDLLIRGEGERLIYLGDVAEIQRGYVDPPESLLFLNGQPAIGLGISTVFGGNVVTMGKAVVQRIEQLKVQIPVGMEVGIISYQSQAVEEAVNGFVVNLLEAVAIVVGILLIFMGVRCGFLIGAVLFLTICGTLLVMNFYGIILERISLGALIIALGMLVDNAIVVTEGMLIKINQGEDRLQAARDVVAQNMWPLLGATIVAVLAFGAIGLSQDNTGEYCRSLFLVLLFSLMMSWVTAVTITPLFAYLFLASSSSSSSKEDPYQGAFFRYYKYLLLFCLKHRWLTIGTVLTLFSGSVFAFGFIENSFFPNSTRPQFMVDLWLPEGTHIRETQKRAAEVEKHLRSLDHITDITTFLGQGGMRFLLTYVPEKTNTSYAQLLVTVDDYRVIDTMKPQLQAWLDAHVPDTIPLVKKFLLGPGEGGKIQIRLSGPDPALLRKKTKEVESIMRKAGAIGIRSDWRERVKVLRPLLSETQARLAGIDRTDLAAALQSSFIGTRVGVYREGDKLLPIISRAPEKERFDVSSIQDLQIWSHAAQRMIPMRQIVAGFETRFEDPMIFRRNRRPTITIHCDQATGNASTLLEKIDPELQAIPMPPGFFMEYGGEHEDSQDAQAALAGKIPFFLILMILTVIFLFDAIRQPLIIWLTVPLALIGVALGLLITSQPFGFMALLGALSLSGMLIKNSIVLLDAIDLDIRLGKEPFLAVVDSGVSRLRPVAMAALTTVLGMIPLLTDAFFIAMAVTIMFGLTFATLLTLIIVPTLYTVFFRIPYRS